MRKLFSLAIIFMCGYGSSWTCQAASQRPAIPADKISFEIMMDEIRQEYSYLSEENLAEIHMFILITFFNPFQTKAFIQLCLDYLRSQYTFTMPDISSAPDPTNYKTIRELLERANSIPSKNPLILNETLILVKEQLLESCFNYLANKDSVRQGLSRFIKEQNYTDQSSEC